MIPSGAPRAHWAVKPAPRVSVIKRIARQGRQSFPVRLILSKDLFLMMFLMIVPHDWHLLASFSAVVAPLKIEASMFQWTHGMCLCFFCWIGSHNHWLYAAVSSLVEHVRPQRTAAHTVQRILNKVLGTSEIIRYAGHSVVKVVHRTLHSRTGTELFFSYAGHFVVEVLDCVLLKRMCLSLKRKRGTKQHRWYEVEWFASTFSAR